jgi:hypothetical protein
VLRKKWPEVRAGLIAFAILLGLIDGLPLAPPESVPAWQREIVDVVRPIQTAALTPFKWVTQGLRFRQRWALFQGAKRDRFRFQVNVHGTDGTWSLLYRAGDPEHAGYADMLFFRRVRGAWGAADTTPQQYFPFAQWFTRRVLDEHPEIDGVQVRFEKVVIEAGRMIPTGTFAAPFVRGRGPR